MRVACIALALFSPWTTLGQGDGNPLNRLVAEAQARPDWVLAENVTEKLNLIREVALTKGVASDPVSDRYLITALGGPIDMVHFLGLAIPVCSGEVDRKTALFDHWEREGGREFEAGKTGTYPTEAHPDDLPSNALGALFGEEIRNQIDEPDFDVIGALMKFLRPLEALPDRLVKVFSHRKLVMGLRDDADFEMIRSRSEWFTAKPLFCLYAIDRERAKRLGDSAVALREAGFQVTAINGKPIGIERVPK